MNDQVTKVKNEGRFAAGKRLVEWNRKNKADLLKNKAQVDSSDASSLQVPSQVDSSGDQVPPQVNSSVWYGGGLGAIILVGGALYLHTRRATPATPSTPVNPSLLPDNDIFRMH